MKAIHAATFAARLIGFVTLWWVYFAYTDLRWLLHLHAVHLRLPRSTFTFSYNAYLACNIAYLSVATIAAFVLLVVPSWLLSALTPIARSARSLNAFWFTTWLTIGLILLVLGVHTVLSTIMWTVYQSGKNTGWQMDLSVSALVAVAGVILCRSILARRHEE